MDGYNTSIGVDNTSMNDDNTSIDDDNTSMNDCDYLDLVLEKLSRFGLTDKPNYKDMNSYEAHLRKINIEEIERLTCAYCFVTFSSRNKLFRHLRDMEVDTTEVVKINVNRKRRRHDCQTSSMKDKKRSMFIFNAYRGLHV